MLNAASKFEKVAHPDQASFLQRQFSCEESTVTLQDLNLGDENQKEIVQQPRACPHQGIKLF